VLAPRGVQTRDSVSPEGETELTAGLGARRWERDRGNARFTTRKPLGEPTEPREEYWSFTRLEPNAPLTSQSPPPSRTAIGLRSRLLQRMPRSFPRATS